MNASSEGETFPGSVQIPGGTTVLVELTPDIHICGICKQQFNNLDAFVAHKQSGCQLTSTSGATPSTVQFVSEETVPATQTQTTTRTITSETQTITVSAPEFVFEHGYQTYLPTESNENQTATVISLPAKSRAKKPTVPPAQKRLNCCYPGCQFKTAYGMKDMERHLKIHTGDKPHKCEVCGKCFSRKDKLKTHMRCHTGVKPYKCKTCDYAAADSSSLNKHLRIHSDERPFKCQICPYASRNSSQLTVHLRSHTGDAPFQCWLCSAKFKISSDLKRHMRVHSGEKPFKCEFCNVRCTMKGNLKSHIRIKHSGNNFKCPHCDFLGDSKATLRKHSRVHQSEHPEKCSECSYSCSSKAALRIHERIHCTDRPFKCSYCSFDTKQPSNLSKHMKKFHGDMVKTEASERKDSGRQSSRQVAKLDAKKTFHCDICDASFMREDSLRSHKRQHSEYGDNKNSDVTVLQFQIDPGKPPAAPLTVGHLQVPLQPSQVPQFSEGRVKIIVGHQGPPANTIVQAAAAAVNIVPPALVAQNAEELPGNSRLQILRQVNLIAPPQSSGCPSEAGAMAQPAVLLTTHDQADGATLHQTLIPTAPGGPQEGSGNQTFITSSGITCTDFEGLNALIQEGTAEVTVVSDGGQNIAVATTATPIFSSSSQQELPKQAYPIMQGGPHPALLCPADSIPD
ncbi:zinc finger protein 64 isoform X1 [Pteropus medius]|uniref:Zinc finger protein 64 isoform X1 n=1 Tax=Pteropus vampyrus TaxID=132908 RepID=A0A6P3QWQ3_PTEVA|nr:zinc finger protein 64 isoform X1 [Pteropus vampyrus]XP_011364258.1 zinc finger protein 64 isoform X5 [Pteropus vampyrus]XP_039720577.1 zinc finger protein 64 isoform X1 [Pteropus giganteus]